MADDPDHAAALLYDAMLSITQPVPPDDSSPQRVCDILTRAYGERAISVNAWLKSRTVYAGVLFNASIDFRRDIDRGPHPKSESAESFREFWGAKSTLRRFPDGTLLEALSWGENPIEEIALFALQTHYAPDVKIEFAPVDLSQLFRLPGHDFESPSPSDAFDELVGLLRGIESTVKITSVLAKSPYLRNTAVFPYEQITPKSHYLCLCPPSIGIVAKLEVSTAWPLQLTPLLQFKIAVYIDISKHLTDKKVSSRPHYEGLTILFRGFVFELEGFHPNELHDFLGTPHGQKVSEIEKLHTVHHSFVAALATRFSSFSVACRCAVRWVRAKGVSSAQLPHEAVELLVAHVYTGGAPPACAYRGLLCFLGALAAARCPARVCVQDARAAPDLGALPLAVVAPFCPQSAFTRATTAATVRFLASAAAQSLRSAADLWFARAQEKAAQLFAVPTSHWRIVVFLEPAARPHAEWALGATKRAAGRFEARGAAPPPLEELFVDFDPAAAFVAELRERFGALMAFWYDELGGVAVGASFPDGALAARPMRDDGLALACVENDGEVVLSVDLVVEQIRLIGGELVRSVQRRG